MMSASAISAMIRSKKKKMEEEKSGAVKLSGIPEDATDAMVAKNHEYGEMLSENKPKDRDEEPSIESEMDQEKKSQPHEDMAPNPHVLHQDDHPEEHELKLKRMSKIKSLMSRMGK